jgi:8-oxo-dGTP pyrophosphatase MutT (NUDIX family)
MENKSVLAMIEKKDGMFLAIPHRVTGKLGFPGGKVDPGESLLSALKRECNEEAGIKVWDLGQVFAMPESGFTVYTFRCDYTGEILTGDSGVPVWVTRETLEGSEARYPEYNRAAFAAMVEISDLSRVS